MIVFIVAVLVWQQMCHLVELLHKSVTLQKNEIAEERGNL